MEAIKKQASKLREQVARQQQTILRQMGQLGHEGIMFDEADMLRHQQLQNLYKSTRAAKHFQKDIVRGLEGFISTSKKQMEIATKLAEDCCKYGIENQDCGFLLASVASDFGTSHASMEDHRETMLGILGYQVSEPLRALMGGAPLKDARHLTQRYDRMRREFEIQLKSSMLALGREATAATLSVEDQQKETTFQKLLTMVEAERSYHRNVMAILEKLHYEMILEEQTEDSSLESEIQPRDENIPSPDNEIVSNRTSNGQDDDVDDKTDTYFIANLNLEVDDYVVVGSNGWSEGECNGKAGWFLSVYVEKRYTVPANKLSEQEEGLQTWPESVVAAA
ncbi:hypothetical protein ACJIZ3_022209 [Penstemon smallii]|uniref:SH3 domain-containing protein n=1 Tax=Penstemon smallii TaxID=265156 RepID=A0ABD3SP76_9LAMI